MRHTACLLTPARALHRVLLLELANTTSKSTAITSSPGLLFSSGLRNPPTSKHARTPGAALAPCRCTTHRAFSTTTPSRAIAQRTMQKKNPRDTAIPYRWVRIAGGSGNLSAPQRTDTVIANLPRGHSLVMVAPPPPPPPPAPGVPVVVQPSAAICRIIDAAAEEEAAKAAAKAAEVAAKESKQVAQQTKTLELNWAIAPHDLAHRMKRLAEFLDKGMRVDIMLARKRGSRKATPEEGRDLVERIQQTVSDVPGAAEYKKMDGNVCGVLKMFFEGPKDRRKVKKNKNGKAGEED
ncbi:hypothetical protein E0Z10_g6797 [Xylaria hypoxylon]|uniref:Translation initiation factor 3 C-terminal domain-containing protein n=1 Tax=Xylaria hypoxylon TaxID=37992 RepID=A0A4Z0YSE0_9PEZI|nr:hypothetical protein E0Z10_g6797 [Xylaria hypoxylon]